MTRLLVMLLLLLVLCSCGSVKIVPQHHPGSNITIEDKTARQQQRNVLVSIRIYDLNVYRAPVDKNICSFWVEIANQQQTNLSVSATDFLLIDVENNQHQNINPEDLLQLIRHKVPYLIPYPYFGYFYLEDRVKGHLDTQYRSEANYFPSRRPELINLEALQKIDLQPDSIASGAIYFPVELRTLNGFKVQYHPTDINDRKTTPMIFPFSVEKE